MGFVINGKFASQRITGVQRVAYELTRAMQARAHSPNELEVVVPHNAADLGLASRRVRFGASLKGNLWEQISLPIATARDTLISLCNTGPLLKRNQVVMVHDMAVYDVPHAFSKKFLFWYRSKFSILRRQTLLILTVSNFSKSRICHHLKMDPSNVEVIRPGADHLDRLVADHSIIGRLSLTKDAYCVIVGSLDPRKNLQRVLDAIKQLGHIPNIKFVIAGGANARVFAAQGATTQAVDDRVIWAGFVSDAELKALYTDAACLIFPSLYEGCGLPPLEAMYCGCPVIVSTAASLPEVCGDAAMYCDPESVEDIAAKITLMTTSPDLREHHRKTGLQHVGQYRWDHAATRLAQVLYGERHGGAPYLEVQSRTE
ncbi:group 1 glycosyl transferase [Caballeronia arationis]|uniref:Glycosyltransferase Family 4 n=1 Tax=Caballeronia arationis TaxID=1777142 RepID=A0A7Z7N766_9BURK|nr:glycosyltransferase family 1 protein [Caballeronia arationis]SAL05127.1 group 1 glycosyl transferase [Caballeronia arationis]SOE88679.1 Glycosyltransferase Family 4 [Caballeronia arationis]